MASELEHFSMLIGGKAVGAASGATFESNNPYTGRPWAVVPDGGPADVHDELIRLVAERAERIKLGDPNAADTEMGPVANEPQYRKVMGYLDKAGEEGATIAYGGAADSGLGGLFVQPTVLTGVTPASTVFKEEVFGPVLAALTFTDEEEAVKLANDTPYGLAGAVWTKDVHRAHRVAGPDQGRQRVDQRLPGGRSLGAVRRIQAVRTRPGERHSRHRRVPRRKAVWIELTGGTRDPFTLG